LKSRSWLGTGTKCGRLKQINKNPILSLFIIGSPTAIKIETNDKKPAKIFFHLIEMTTWGGLT
jgi:hypothetical protein